MTISSNLGLPFIDAAQAQKHVTHNDALRILDVLVQPAVVSRTVTAPPATPAEGDRYIVPAGATGAWAGQTGKVVVFQDATWVFLTGKAGWVAWVVAEGTLAIFDGSAWIGSAMGGSAIVSTINTALGGTGWQLGGLHTHIIADVTGLQAALDAKAPLASPALTGTPTAPTASAGTNTTQIASTAFVTAAISAGGGAVTSVAGRTGAVTLAAADISGLGTLATASSVNLTTQATGTLQAAQEPAHTGDVTNTAGSLALTVAANAVTNAKAAQMPANTLKGNNTGAAANAADLTATQAKSLLAIAVADVTGAAPLASPALTGTPTAPTASAGTNTTQIATTAYADAGLSGKVAASGGALQNAALVGVNATADTTNKLAVASAAVLFNNIGNGVQLKVNKNAATDTASLLYQDGFSGRAEIGLTGDDNFHFKVSADGSTFKDAIQLDRTSGLGTVFGDPTAALGIATKQYVDAHSGGVAVSEVEIDFGAAAVRSRKFSITDAAVTAASKLIALQSGKAATGRSADENEMDILHFAATPSAGAFTLYAACLTGRVSGKYKVSYLIG